MNRQRQHGFSLLEAIVALVIFTMGALALYGWLGSNLITLDRVNQRQQANALAASALDVVRRVNPMETPTGRRVFDEVEISWKATPIEPPRPAVTQVGLPGLFEVGLYTLAVEIRRDGELVDTLDVRQIGHRQVRQMDVE